MSRESERERESESAALSLLFLRLRGSLRDFRARGRERASGSGSKWQRKHSQHWKQQQRGYVLSPLTIKPFIRFHFMRHQVLRTDGVRQLSRDFDMVGQNGESCQFLPGQL